MTASRRGRRRARTVVVGAVLAGLAALTACSAGKVTQTSRQQPPIAGTNADIGAIGLRNVQISFNGPEGYPVGANAPLQVRIFNQGATVVRLTGVTAAGTAERVVLIGTPTPTSGPLPSATPAESPSPSPSASPSEAPSGSPSESPSPSPSATPTPTGPTGRANFSVEIPPGSYVLLVPGQGSGYLQLVGLTRELQTGLWATITFTFDNGVTAPIDVPVGVPEEALPRPEPVQHGEATE